jgi:hypothetical protein
VTHTLAHLPVSPWPLLWPAWMQREEVHNGGFQSLLVLLMPGYGKLSSSTPRRHQQADSEGQEGACTPRPFSLIYCLPSVLRDPHLSHSGCLGPWGLALPLASSWWVTRTSTLSIFLLLTRPASSGWRKPWGFWVHMMWTCFLLLSLSHWSSLNLVPLSNLHVLSWI